MTLVRIIRELLTSFLMMRRGYVPSGWEKVGTSGYTTPTVLSITEWRDDGMNRHLGIVGWGISSGGASWHDRWSDPVHAADSKLAKSVEAHARKDIEARKR